MEPKSKVPVCLDILLLSGITEIINLSYWLQVDFKPVTITHFGNIYSQQNPNCNVDLNNPCLFYSISFVVNAVQSYAEAHDNR